MQTLNSYLKGLYDGEQEKVASTSLEAKLSNMSADELLKIAVGDTPDKLTMVHAGKPLTPKQEAEHESRLMKTMTTPKQHKEWAAWKKRKVPADDHTKTGSAEAEKLAWADGWGRQLAQIENSTMKLASLRAKIAGAHCGKTACMGEKNADLGTEGAYLKGFGRGSGVVGATAAARQYRAKTADMEAQADFTSPEAQEKARVVQQALKATKGAPASVRKASVKMTAEKLKTAGLPRRLNDVLAMGHVERTKAVERLGPKIEARMRNFRGGRNLSRFAASSAKVGPGVSPGMASHRMAADAIDEAKERLREFAAGG